VRLDLFLRNTGLIKRRALAHDACESGAVLVEGKPGRPGQAVRPGQQIAILWPHRLLEIEVLALPARPVGREERARCFRVIREERREPAPESRRPPHPDDWDV